MANSAINVNNTYNIDIPKREYEQREGGANISSIEDLIKTTYNSREVINVNDNHVEYNAGVCTSGNITVADILNLGSIRGGGKMTCGCGMAGGCAMTGGCFTCKKGNKNIIHIYKTVHIIIPKLYSNYNSDIIKKKSIKGKKGKKGK
jgi:hypothetical protein